MVKRNKKIYVYVGVFRALHDYQRFSFYSTTVPTYKSFTLHVTTRKSYARGARTAGRFISRNLGQREKITRFARWHITSVPTWYREDKSMVQSHANATL